MKKRALVTGASEGIGRAFALRLAERGYEVIGVARNADRLDSLLREMSGNGHRKIVADLSSAAGVSTVVKELTAGPKVHLLINNAGYGLIGDFAKTPIEKHQAMMDLNISALVALSHAFLSRAEKGDGLIQVSSTLSFLPMPVQPVYSATKAFVTSFSESLWFQNRMKGIQVLNLCPGATRTHFSARSGGESGVIPEFVLETPEQVVDAGLNAYDRGIGPTVISGWKNQLLVFLSRLVSRKTLIRISGKVER